MIIFCYSLLQVASHKITRNSVSLPTSLVIYCTVLQSDQDAARGKPYKKKIDQKAKILASMDFVTAVQSNNIPNSTANNFIAAASGSSPPSLPPASRYENQKRRDWNTFCQYLSNHRPPLPLAACSGAHVLEFLRYLDQFGKTKVHSQNCPFFGIPNPPGPCPCPLRQAWGSLDALIGRLRAAYDEHGGKPEANPFGAKAVRLFLREVRDFQAKSRGVSYEKKRKRPKQKLPLPPPSVATQ